MVQERVAAVRLATRGIATVDHIHRTMPQDPETPGFRDLWQGIMIGLGIRKGDLIVASEPYAAWLAESVGAEFVPYDIERQINDAKATRVRDFMEYSWNYILPEFRPHVQTRVTIFGAESTGKTRLSRRIGISSNAKVLPEYARPYLENTVNEINRRSMTAIWKGQAALQRMPFLDKPVILQDTDLYSTLGYWQGMSKRIHGGGVPGNLSVDAVSLKSDLYLITTSKGIDFEPDPLRYGGDHRELDDAYWLERARAYDLPFVVLPSGEDFDRRLRVAKALIQTAVREKAALIQYDRGGF